MPRAAWLNVREVPDCLQMARRVLHCEAAALRLVAGRLNEAFASAVATVENSRGRVAVSGVGKSAAIAQKIAGTLNSTGTRAYFLDATSAAHGDLGMVHPADVALVLSHSGASDEILRLLPALRKHASSIIVVTNNAASPLAQAADVVICCGPIQEACPLSLAPSSSTTAMLALGDALAFALSSRRGFSAEDFASYHPAGSLGRRLAKVDDHMRRGRELRLAPASATVRNVLAHTACRGRRSGAIILLDADGRLAGVFTDSDLARLLERRAEAQLDRPICEVMTIDPWTVSVGSQLEQALDILRKNKISELPVVDEQGRPVGMLDITDLFALVPVEDEECAEGPFLSRTAA